MTPEDNFQKIENSLRHMLGLHAEHTQRLDRNEADIRELIVACRLLLDAQRVSNQDLEEFKANVAVWIREIHGNIREIQGWKLEIQGWIRLQQPKDSNPS